MSSLGQRHGIEPFELFCAYYLGITADDGYRFQNLHDVARRFGVASGVIKQLLADYRLDADSILHSTFDMASAQVDIMAAPPGVSRRELARAHWEELQKAPRRGRDWAKELASDAVENEKVFGASAARGGEATRASGGSSSRDRGTPGGSPAGRGTRRGPRS